jgi:hypothetical protein
MPPKIRRNHQKNFGIMAQIPVLEGARAAEIAMRAGETELQMCVQHVAEQENRVARQDVLVERLRESGSCLLDDALRLLAEMHKLLKTMHEHVARFSN